MKTNLSILARNLLLLSIGVILLASLWSCKKGYSRRDVDVTSKTKYSGTINGSPISIDVVATINTGRGGRSSCIFTTVPSGFNPAVLGTMA
jgi:hypothetical protein